MFSREGKPVRATIDVTLSEYKSMSGESMTAPQKDKHKTETKTTDEELPQMAARIYGDSAKWREIAKENHISNPRLIPEGIQLNIRTLS